MLSVNSSAHRTGFVDLYRNIKTNEHLDPTPKPPLLKVTGSSVEDFFSPTPLGAKLSIGFTLLHYLRFALVFLFTLSFGPNIALICQNKRIAHCRNVANAIQQAKVNDRNSDKRFNWLFDPSLKIEDIVEILGLVSTAITVLGGKQQQILESVHIDRRADKTVLYDQLSKDASLIVEAGDIYLKKGDQLIQLMPFAEYVDIHHIDLTKFSHWTGDDLTGIKLSIIKNDEGNDEESIADDGELDTPELLTLPTWDEQTLDEYFISKTSEFYLLRKINRIPDEDKKISLMKKVVASLEKINPSQVDTGVRLALRTFFKKNPVYTKDKTISAFIKTWVEKESHTASTGSTLVSSISLSTPSLPSTNTSSSLPLSADFEGFSVVSLDASPRGPISPSSPSSPSTLSSPSSSASSSTSSSPSSSSSSTTSTGTSTTDIVTPRLEETSAPETPRTVVTTSPSTSLIPDTTVSSTTTSKPILLDIKPVNQTVSNHMLTAIATVAQFFDSTQTSLASKLEMGYGEYSWSYTDEEKSARTAQGLIKVAKSVNLQARITRFVKEADYEKHVIDTIESGKPVIAPILVDNRLRILRQQTAQQSAQQPTNDEIIEEKNPQFGKPVTSQDAINTMTKPLKDLVDNSKSAKEFEQSINAHRTSRANWDLNSSSQSGTSRTPEQLKARATKLAIDQFPATIYGLEHCSESEFNEAQFDKLLQEDLFHTCVITGYDKSTKVVTIVHWGRTYQTTIHALSTSSALLHNEFNSVLVTFSPLISLN